MQYSESDVEAATLSSTLPYEGNSITKCPSSNVILTCMVTQRPTLRWEAVPGLSEQTFIPDFIDTDSDRVVEGPFTLTLVDVSHRTQSSGGVADLTSTLEVMVDDIDDGTNITCKGTTDEDYVVIHKIGMHIEMSILMPYLERVYTLYKEMYIESMHNMRLCAYKSLILITPLHV